MFCLHWMSGPPVKNLGERKFHCWGKIGRFQWERDGWWRFWEWEWGSESLYYISYLDWEIYMINTDIKNRSHLVGRLMLSDLRATTWTSLWSREEVGCLEARSPFCSMIINICLVVRLHASSSLISSLSSRSCYLRMACGLKLGWQGGHWAWKGSQWRAAPSLSRADGDEDNYDD